MKSDIWINPEIKKVLLGFIITSIMISAGFCIYSNYFWNSLNKDITYQNIATIGKLINRHPELKNDIIASFTKETGKNEIEKGILESKKYGYDLNLPLRSCRVLNSYSRRDFKNVMIFSLLIIALNLFIVLSIIISIYNKLNHITYAAEKIVEGDFSIKLYEEKEGTISKLGHQFNQMSKRLELTMEELKNERIYLKNTISDISHQLKTPLTSVKMLNELLIEGAAEKKETRDEFLEKSRIQLERMEWLILNLLKLARIEAGVIKFQDKRDSIVKTLEEAVEDLSISWKGKNQRVGIIQSDDDIFIPHDRQWLKEAFINIIKNGIEHTDEGGTITIEIFESPVMVRVLIKDNGEGISKENLPYIFQRFYRGKNSGNSKGTGIGLALAKAIIENENGMISVTSEINKGTTFVITFTKGILN